MRHDSSIFTKSYKIKPVKEYKIKKGQEDRQTQPRILFLDLNENEMGPLADRELSNKK